MSNENGELLGRMERWCSDVMKEADEFVVYMFESEETTDYNRMAFDDIEMAANFKRGANALTSVHREVLEDITNPTSFLESLVEAEQKGKKSTEVATTDQAASILQGAQEQETLFGMSVEEFEGKFKNIKKKLKKRRQKFEEEAKDALLEAAKLYLGDKHTHKYVEYKMKLERSGVGAIMYQIHTMEESLHSLTARIKAAGAHVSTRDIEVFTGLQRVILDAQKFQFDYLQSVEQSMKELKADLELAEQTLPEGSKNSEGTVIFFRGGKEFLKELNNLHNTNMMKDFVPTESKNVLLNPKAEVTDVAFEEASPDAKKEETKMGSERNPFNGYADAPKRQKRNRGGEFDEEGSNDDLDI